MTTQADNAQALRRSLETPPVGSQEAFPTPSPDQAERVPPEMFRRLLAHMQRCTECPEDPCEVGRILARMWLLIEETRERITWL